MASENGFVLGLDLGVRSVGLALIDPEEQNILCTAARVFPAGVDSADKFALGTDESNNRKRREARLARRQTERRARRLRKVFHVLQRGGFLPVGEAPECIRALDGGLALRYPAHPGVPYTLRARALDVALDAHELGRALYHLAQRRGFKSNRKAAPKKDEEEGKVAGEISELRRKMVAAGARTLGEYFW